MKNEEYKIKGIIKIMNANDEGLLRFIALELFTKGAKRCDDWKIMYEVLDSAIELGGKE